MIDCFISQFESWESDYWLGYIAVWLCCINECAGKNY